MVINQDKIGKCYELSLQFILSNHDYKLVHGTITNLYPPFQTIDHAWCIKDDIIRDAVHEKDFPIVVYNALFNAKVIKEYSFNEVIDMMNEFGTYGPWGDVDEVDGINGDFYDKNGNIRDEWKGYKIW